MSGDRARYLLLGAWLAIAVVVTVVEGTPALAELQEELDRHRAAIDGLAEQLDALRPSA